MTRCSLRSFRKPPPSARDAVGSQCGYDASPRFQMFPESPVIAYVAEHTENVLSRERAILLLPQALWYESATPTGP